MGQHSEGRAWEVFGPSGIATRRVRWERLARFYAWLDGQDYALEGDGWLPGAPAGPTCEHEHTVGRGPEGDVLECRECGEMLS